MPTIALTDRKVAGLKATPDKQMDYFDRSFPGFGVRVSQHGRKTFILMYRNAERRFTRLTLGTYGQYDTDLTLAKAREKARAELRKATEGRDPATERKTARAQTFGALADFYLEKHAKRHKRSWRDDARMIRQELDVWAHKPAAGIRRADVRELLERIVQRGAPVLANRVLALVRKMLNFAIDQEWIDANPAAKMPRPGGKELARSRVLTADELRAIWTYLEQPPDSDLRALDQRCWTLTRAALRLRLLTAQRGKEIIEMRWRDIEGDWWTIPGTVTKNKVPHRVPLTKTARHVLEALKAGGEAEYVFVGIRGTRQRRGALVNLKVDDVRPHDFRRTAASMMTSAGIPRLTVAKVLNHVSADAGVTAIYDRHSYDAEKRVALETWERTLLGIVKQKTGGKVKAFAKRA
jgi:integrase